MNRFRMITGRLAVILSAMMGALLAFWSGSGPTAFAAVAAPLGGDPRGHPGLRYDQSGLPYHHLPAHAHTLATSGMPGWQITLIAVGAALLAAALAVTAYRMRAARRRVTVSAA
jgi:hypothetical protein